MQEIGSFRIENRFISDSCQLSVDILTKKIDNVHMDMFWKENISLKEML